VRQRGREHLDGDIAAKLRVSRTIDLAHAANADGLRYLIRPEPGASQDRHRYQGERTDLFGVLREIGADCTEPAPAASSSTARFATHAVGLPLGMEPEPRFNSALP